MTANRISTARWPVMLFPMLLACAVSSCSWQGYAVTRGIRSVTGFRTKVHSIVPVSSLLRKYRVIEAHALENLLPGRMPSELERFLNDALLAQLKSIDSSPSVVRFDPEFSLNQAADPAVSFAPTLVLEGFIDDYDPGYIGLRLVELGFNHMVITIRVQLRDKETGAIVGAASITAQDDRVTATARDTIARLAQRVRALIEAGYAGR